MARTNSLPFLAAVTALLSVLLTSGAARAQSSAEVQVTADATRPDTDGKQVITVTLHVNPGWHAYANPVDNEELKDSKTVVEVKAGGKPVDARVDYPAGKLTSIDGHDAKVYEDKVTIKATLQRARDGAGPLEVHVTVQVCNKNSCLRPSTVKVPVSEPK